MHEHFLGAMPLPRNTENFRWAQAMYRYAASVPIPTPKLTRDIDGRAVGEVLGELLRVESGRHEDHLQVLPGPGQQVPEKGDQEIGQNVPLVNL